MMKYWCEDLHLRCFRVFLEMPLQFIFLSLLITYQINFILTICAASYYKIWNANWSVFPPEYTSPIEYRPIKFILTYTPRVYWWEFTVFTIAMNITELLHYLKQCFGILHIFLIFHLNTFLQTRSCFIFVFIQINHPLQKTKTFITLATIKVILTCRISL